jgi:hypothetical protein
LSDGLSGAFQARGWHVLEHEATGRKRGVKSISAVVAALAALLQAPSQQPLSKFFTHQGNAARCEVVCTVLARPVPGYGEAFIFSGPSAAWFFNLSERSRLVLDRPLLGRDLFVLLIFYCVPTRFSKIRHFSLREDCGQIRATTSEWARPDHPATRGPYVMVNLRHSIMVGEGAR